MNSDSENRIASAHLSTERDSTEVAGTELAATRGHRAPYFWLPNALTTGALWAGFYAIVAGIDHNFSRAAVGVFVAMIFDGLDGRVARWTNTQSEFGKEYDSLSDMVSFGLAPAILAYQFGVVRLAEYNIIWGRLGWIATFLYAACAAMRLARFNSRAATADKKFFEGLPSPSAAATVAGFIWLAAEYKMPPLLSLVLGFVITTIIALLMVSSFAYWSGKDLNVRGRVRWSYLWVIPIGYIVISAGPGEALFAMFAIYAFHAPLLWIWRKAFNRRSHESHAKS